MPVIPSRQAHFQFVFAERLIGVNVGSNTSAFNENPMLDRGVCGAREQVLCFCCFVPDLKRFRGAFESLEDLQRRPLFA
jgi:hypothetical protein